jgi:hypothetical protein
VPAGDIGVGAREISYMFGQYKRLRNRFTGILTGKGLSFGGSLIRMEATGYGCVYFCRQMLEHAGESLEGKTCVVSGSGNVALYTMEKLTQLGARVLTASDSSGFVHDPAGIDEDKIAWLKELKEVRRGRIDEYAENFSSADFHPGRPGVLPPISLFRVPLRTSSTRKTPKRSSKTVSKPSWREPTCLANLARFTPSPKPAFSLLQARPPTPAAWPSRVSSRVRTRYESPGHAKRSTNGFRASCATSTGAASSTALKTGESTTSRVPTWPAS